MDESASAEVDPLQNESSPEMDVSASAEIVPPQAEPSDILFSSSPVATEPVINLILIFHRCIKTAT